MHSLEVLPVVCHKITFKFYNVKDKLQTLYMKGYTATRLTDEFPNKSWTKHGANKLLKKLRDTGTVDRWRGSGRPRTEENVETVNDLVSSQQDKPQTHRTVRDISWETSIHWCTQSAICLNFLPYLLNIYKKIEFLISQGSVATCLR